MEIQVELQDIMGSDRTIAEAAWTSAYSNETKDKKTEEDVSTLVSRLATEGHGVPFEHVVFRFWINMPIFIDRQHMTHRIGMSHSGMSSRYRNIPYKYFDCPDDVIDIMETMSDNLKTPQAYELLNEYYKACETAHTAYQIAMKLAKTAKEANFISNSEFKRFREIYKGILPVNTFVERVTTMNLRSFAHYYKLRSSSHAQPEVKQVAELMLKQLEVQPQLSGAIAALKSINWSI